MDGVPFAKLLWYTIGHPAAGVEELNESRRRHHKAGRQYASCADYKLTKGLQVEILAKLEYFNPCGSVKDRIGVAMIEAAEAVRARLNQNGFRRADEREHGHCVGLRVRRQGYRLILTMPDTMSVERRAMLRALGAELVLTPASVACGAPSKGPRNSSRKSLKPSCPSQFKNRANVEAHKGRPPKRYGGHGCGADVLVAGVGTAVRSPGQ